MKLSSTTKDILRNFSSINTNLAVSPGSDVSTISEQKNIIAKCTLEESFDSKFAIYDLTEFLSALSLFKDPELVFGDLDVNIVGDGGNLRYMYTDPSIITTPQRPVTMPDPDLSFVLTEHDFKSLQKAAAILSVEDMKISVKSQDECTILVNNRSNDTSNVYSIDRPCVTNLSPTDDYSTFMFKVDNLKLLSGDYNVQLSRQGISRFTHTTQSLVYYIALEN